MSRTKNILVTGGCGFIGSNFIRAALAQQDLPVGRLINLDALTYAGSPSNLADLQDSRYELVRGDIADRALVDTLLAERQIDLLVNFAAESHVDRSIDRPAPFVQTNVVGTVALLESALAYYRNRQAAGHDSFCLVHISTDEVYGTLADGAAPFTESSPYVPSNPYAASKAAADHFVRSFYRTYGLPIMVSHSSNNYGPWQLPEKFIPLMVCNGLTGQPLTVFGDGRAQRDWIYVMDYVAGLLALLQRGRVGETYHFGGGTERSNLEVVREICRLLDRWAPLADGSGHEKWIQFVADRPGHDLRYAMDTAKARRELAWAPRMDFATGLRETVDWYLRHQEWCNRAARYMRKISQK